MSEEKSKMKIAIIGAGEIGKTTINPEQTGGGVVILVNDPFAPEATTITNPYRPDMVEPYVSPSSYKSGKELRRERRKKERKKKKNRK